ncbi:hypothetical protein XM38_040930 [Halomicronema hongdechloris C2206]|uniref:Uncharacterized protein n=1 Tax=Halomicronema hongdechloris C2206 TaxID=1641165 RepID=A0A1Z3HS43_9CYAN|nr:hypothetical protein XM38_040930 [Halomicronema hongdechloris C2206]
MDFFAFFLLLSSFPLRSPRTPTTRAFRRPGPRGKACRLVVQDRIASAGTRWTFLPSSFCFHPFPYAPLGLLRPGRSAALDPAEKPVGWSFKIALHQRGHDGLFAFFLLLSSFPLRSPRTPMTRANRLWCSQSGSTGATEPNRLWCMAFSQASA